MTQRERTSHRIGNLYHDHASLENYKSTWQGHGHTLLGVENRVTVLQVCDVSQSQKLASKKLKDKVSMFQILLVVAHVVFIRWPDVQKTFSFVREEIKFSLCAIYPFFLLSLLLLLFNWIREKIRFVLPAARPRAENCTSWLPSGRITFFCQK